MKTFTIQFTQEQINILEELVGKALVQYGSSEALDTLYNLLVDPDPDK